MDDATGTKIDIMLIYGSKSEIWFNIRPTTTRQEFIERLQNWLGNEFPRNFIAFFYDEQSKRMRQLNNSEPFYFTALFNSISSRNGINGVQSLISNGDSFTPSHSFGGASTGINLMNYFYREKT